MFDLIGLGDEAWTLILFQSSYYDSDAKFGLRITGAVYL